MPDTLPTAYVEFYARAFAKEGDALRDPDFLFEAAEYVEAVDECAECGKPVINSWKTLAEVPASTPESDAMSRDLKKRGFRFVGSTIIYAYMQAIGMVDDHLVDCVMKPRMKRLS